MPLDLPQATQFFKIASSEPNETKESKAGIKEILNSSSIIVVIAAWAAIGKIFPIYSINVLGTKAKKTDNKLSLFKSLKGLFF